MALDEDFNVVNDVQEVQPQGTTAASPIGPQLPPKTTTSRPVRPTRPPKPGLSAPPQLPPLLDEGTDAGGSNKPKRTVLGTNQGRQI